MGCCNKGLLLNVAFFHASDVFIACQFCGLKVMVTPDATEFNRLER